MFECLDSILSTTYRIRIVADCVALPCQVTQKLKRATTLEFTAIPAIIFIHCWHFVVYSLAITSKSIL